MEPARIYEYLVNARARVLDWTQPLSAADYARPFAIGPGSLARTFTHVMISEWYYIERIMRRKVPAYAQWPIRDEEPLGFAALEAAWAQQALRTREAIAAMNSRDPAQSWKATIEYVVDSDDGRRRLVRTVAEDIFTQLVLHEVHHRSQAMNMLRQLGVEAQDIDFNTMMYQIEEMG